MGKMFAVKISKQNSMNPLYGKKIQHFKPECVKSLLCEVTPLALTFAMFPMPAHASGKVFDFNATLPAMAIQFLILMVFLDKTWFGPIGKVIDERDAKIRARLSSVKTGDDELENLAKAAETLLKDARAEAQTKIADAKGAAAE